MTTPPSTPHPLPKCIDCKHIKTEVTTKRICKLNDVGRDVGDTCCWDTKRYPSRFEQGLPNGNRDVVLEELRKIVAKLYDDGFKDPLCTFDAAVSMMKHGDIKLRVQEQQNDPY